MLEAGRNDEQTVSFHNRLGIHLVADLYVPKNVDRARRYPAIIVGHPFGGVKEQASGLCAQTMAERGFVTLAFDASYNGESGGQPHFIASHEAFVEDFSAAVDYLGTDARVDRDRIGVIGVCGSGGFSLAAIRVSVGYPDRWPSYEGLDLRADDAYGNAERLERFQYRRALEKLRSPVDRDEWTPTPQQVNAYNMPASGSASPRRRVPRPGRGSGGGG